MKTTVSEQSDVFARPIGVRLGQALLIGFGVIIVLAGLDNLQRQRLETLQEITAVGDNTFFKISGDTQKSSTPVLTFQGQPLYVVGSKPVEIRDSRMIRHGKDDAGQYFVYSTRENIPASEGEAEIKSEGFYFLKVAPGEYLKTRPAPPGK